MSNYNFCYYNDMPPYVTHSEITIHYQIEGNGFPLVLLHGLGESLEDWYDVGYVQQLKDTHQLILIDSRGAGKSDKPHAPSAYDFVTRAEDVMAVLDALNIKKTIFLGFSQGGWVGYPLAGHFADRLAALILIGAQPQLYQRQPANPSLAQTKKIVAGFIESAQHYSQGYYTAAQLQRWATSDLQAIRAALTGDKPSFMHYLPAINIPCLLLVGENDPRNPLIQQAAALIKQAQFQSFPAIDHIGSLLHSDLVLPIIKKFLATSL